VAWFKKEPLVSVKETKVRMPEGLWIKCDHCKESIYKQELERNASVCPRCQRTYPPATPACEADHSGLVQREDDKPEAVRPRIEIYLEKTVPVLDHFRSEGLVSEIDGHGTIEEISAQVLESVSTPPTPTKRTG